MGMIGLIVHTWGGVDKSHAVCPQRGALHAHQAFDAGVHTIRFWSLAFTILSRIFVLLEIIPYYCILCGLSPIYVAAHKQGRNTPVCTLIAKYIMLTLG